MAGGAREEHRAGEVVVGVLKDLRSSLASGVTKGLRLLWYGGLVDGEVFGGLT